MLLIATLIAMIMLLLLLSMIGLFTREQQTVNKRLQKYATTGEKEDKTDPVQSAVAAQWRRLHPVFHQLNQWFLSLPRVAAVDAQIQKAGMPFQGSEFILLQFGASGMLLLIVYIFTGEIGRSLLIAILTAAAFNIYIKVRIVRRRQAFTNQLGDALSMMANALRSGFSLLQAMEFVTKEMQDPIATEFQRALRELQFGIMTDTALENLGRRVDSRDLDLMITAVLIQRQVGGNLAQILDTISLTITERIKMKNEVKTLTAQGRLSGWVVGLLPFALGVFIYVVNPGYLEPLLTDPIGRVLILAGMVSQLIGVLIIRRIVDIDM